jgi:flavin reductase (DIM6/NTAB) family NADH-FMN oxidoreductase RutF
LPIKKDDFRRAMSQFVAGVTVITSRRGDKLHGMTASAVSSVSLEPPLVLVCVDRSADTHDVIKESGIFAVNILSDGQSSLSDRFSSKEIEKDEHLRDVPHRFAATGAPIIEGCLAYLDCRLVGVYPGGDHAIFVGEVEDAGLLDEGEPLLFFRRSYRRLA